jgi:cytochrome c2
MRKLLFFTMYSALFFVSCSEKTATNLHTIFNENNLQKQFFEINITKDTTLVTASGCVIKIPAGSLQSEHTIVRLEIKEAINLNDILLAGLTTKSGNQPLSSAGMIYINTAEGTKASIVKPLEVLVPTEMYNPNMQVYKGEKQNDGKIDWQNPTKLPEDETTKKVSAGEQIFKANCANCHKIDIDYTGPRMLGITYRRPKKWLYDYMKSPAYMTASGDCNSVELFNKWKPTIMTAFPNLENGGGLDSVFAYIKAETDKRGFVYPEYKKTHADSCYDFMQILKTLDAEKSKLKIEQDEFYNIDRTINLTATTNITDIIVRVQNNLTATFYTINVESFGWYNLDVLLKAFDECKESELNVNIQGSDKDDYIVSFVIPSLKVFVDGYKKKNSNIYGFESDGEPKIKIPQGVNCFVVAYREKDDKLVFAKSSFVSSLSQTVNLNPAEISKEQMIKEFSSISLKAEVEDVKNAKEIRNTEKKIENLKKLMPKNCDCGNKEPKADSSVLTYAALP